MSLHQGWKARRVRLMNSVEARRAALGSPVTGFVSQPEPRSMGRIAAGRQLMAGNFLLAGHLVEAPGLPIWDIPVPTSEFEAALHGFGWLDDLAAVGDAQAKEKAQDWMAEWIARFKRGKGPGWTPDLAGRRLIRWIHHGFFLLSGLEEPRSEAYFASLAHHTRFLAARWEAASPGLPRFEALTGLLYAGLSLSGMDEHVGLAVPALGHECQTRIDDGGGIASRNPEELLEVFTLLTWAALALRESGQDPARHHAAAIARIAPTLRSLRHADGALARFHGGGSGAEGQLDQALSASGVRAAARATEAMGFARLGAGRTSVIVDAAAPPGGGASRNAHASTLAFELTSGRRPLIVNCGAGGPFGAEWRRAGRATASHSTLMIEGYSSSRLAGKGRAIGGVEEYLAERPTDVTVARDRVAKGTGLLLSHDGYERTHGLIHVRRLDISPDGRALAGEDALAAMTASQRLKLARVVEQGGMAGVPYSIRFHLHPDVDAALDMGGKAVSLALRSGEIWVFRAEGAPISLAPSVYLEKGRVRPRPAQQIVLATRLLEQIGQITWTLAKAQDTPVAIRDFAIEEEEGQA